MFTPPLIEPVADAALASRIHARLNSQTKPRGSLGALESLALQVALIQRAERPEIHAPQLMVFAADHGVTAEGVSAYPRDVTWQMVMNFLSGGAAASVLSRHADLALTVIDAGVDHDFPEHPALVQRKIARGTANFSVQAAMSDAQCAEALNAGAQIVRDAHRAGATLFAFGEMGIGNTTSASALAARLTGLSLDVCVGAGTGLDAVGIAHKRTVIERALALHHAAQTPLDVLAALGGFEIAMIAGAMLEAARLRCVILVDGFIVTAALLVARAIAPQVQDYCVFAHCSDERGHRAVLEWLNATPLLNLGLRLGEGSGAALSLPIVTAALALFNDMATFESAGVSDQPGA
jgi:nicotinate-nucleotide--dimethylbenzimidazole phosphoribosyltransferase